MRSILCEGGPTLFHTLLAEDLVTELFLCLRPMLAGGEPALDIVAGAALPAPADLWLISCHEAEDSLFLRYRVRRGEWPVSATIGCRMSCSPVKR